MDRKTNIGDERIESSQNEIGTVNNEPNQQKIRPETERAATMDSFFRQSDHVCVTLYRPNNVILSRTRIVGGRKSYLNGQSGRHPSPEPPQHVMIISLKSF